MDKKDVHPSPFRNHTKMDKTAFSVTTLSEKSNDKEYWLSKTPQERLQALEMMRHIRKLIRYWLMSRFSALDES